MKTVHIRSIISKILVALLLISIVATPTFSAVTSDDGYGSSSSAYRGPYDLSADHEVNLYYQDSEALDELRKTIYQELLSWGMTPEAAAGVLGNIVCESAADPSRTQSNVPWSSFSWGTTGLGLIQWTYWSLQANLFNNAHEMGKSWTDLGVQFKAMKDYFGPGTGASYLYEDQGLTSYQIAGKFMDDYEKPAVRNYEVRGNTAVSMYNSYSGLEPESYNGGDYDSEISVDEEGIVTLNAKLVAEWELTGMYSESGLSEYQIRVSLPEALTNYNELNNVTQIGQAISNRNEFNAWATARAAIVFAGMLMVIYAIFLLLAVVFDNVNNFIDLSFVSLFTFGALQYAREEEDGIKAKGFVSTNRMVVVISVLMVIGAFCISGGVFSYLLKAVYWVFSQFG